MRWVYYDLYWYIDYRPLLYPFLHPDYRPWWSLYSGRRKPTQQFQQTAFVDPLQVVALFTDDTSSRGGGICWPQNLYRKCIPKSLSCSKWPVHHRVSSNNPKIYMFKRCGAGCRFNQSNPDCIVVNSDWGMIDNAAIQWGSPRETPCHQASIELVDQLVDKLVVLLLQLFNSPGKTVRHGSVYRDPLCAHWGTKKNTYPGKRPQTLFGGAGRHCIIRLLLLLMMMMMMKRRMTMISPEPWTTLCTSLRKWNSCPHVTRATW